MTKRFPESLNDKEFSRLSIEDRVAYLNEHNAGEFMELTSEEVEKYTEQLEKKWGTDATYKPYALREETSEVVVVENTQGMYGKMSPRLFMKVNM